MHKVIAVNLNDQVYQLDERGYAMLRTYLDQAEAQLAANPDKSEIVRDLEQAIGEKFLRDVSPTKTLVTIADVERVLQEIGPVDGGTNHAGAGSPPAGASGPTPPRRLYQIREGAMISGLCNGLAAYFNLDPTIVRMTAVILAVLETSAFDRPPVVTIGVYTVLMFLVPYARASQPGVPPRAHEAFPDKVQYRVERVKAFLGLHHPAR
jgi:phage shock protein PspC (stress-responsive transcriptional regulator)